ncbi:MAG: TerB family tellurite resistance protein [Chloroflexota bacterium]
MALGRLLGLPSREPDPDADDRSGGASAGTGSSDTETVRRIARELDAIPRDRARYLAAFAYLLTRAAAADLHISDVETAEIERVVEEFGAIPEAQAVLVAEIARTQSLLHGGTEDYLVSRQFRELSTLEERHALLRCCYIVGSADGTITADESSVLQQIARELDLPAGEVNELRREFAHTLSAIQAMERLRARPPGRG